MTSSTESSVVQRAKGLGFSSPSVTTVRGIQDALMITVVSANPAQAVSSLRASGDALVGFLGEAPTNYEGVYLEIDDSSGSPAYIEATAPRDGSGTAWARPDLGIAVGRRQS